MKLQKGKILINNIDELDKTSVDKDDINKVIDEILENEVENKEKLNIALKVMVYAYITGRSLKQVNKNLEILKNGGM